MPPLLSEAEQRLLALILSPANLRQAAVDLCGDPVMGAADAWSEARGMIQALTDSAALRFEEESDREALRDALSKAFSFDRDLQEVAPLDLPYWRTLASACAGQRGVWRIDGVAEVQVPVGAASDAVRAAVIVVLQALLQEHPELNRAYLDGRVWQRSTPEVMVPVQFGADDLGVVVLPYCESPSDVHREAKRAMRRILKARRSPYRRLAERLLLEWVTAGFTASPAAAMVSDVADHGITLPFAAFVEANGIPLSLVIGVRQSGPGTDRVAVQIAADHRVFDPAAAGLVHQTLRERVEELCQG